MIKHKSLRQLASKNKSTNLQSNPSKNNNKMGVDDIVREISELKKQIHRVKTRKSLQCYQGSQINTKTNINIDNCNTTQINKDNVLRDRNGDNVQKDQLEFKKTNTTCKQNVNSQCQQCSRYRKELPSTYKIQLASFCWMKSRQNKLKLNTQMNKIKVELQKVMKQPRLVQCAQLITAELNTSILLLDSMFKQSEHQLNTQTKINEQMGKQLMELTSRILESNQHSRDTKNAKEKLGEEVQELKRHLALYMQVGEESQREVERVVEEKKMVEIYVKELQERCQGLREQVGVLEQKNFVVQGRVEGYEREINSYRKRIELMESEVHLTKVQKDVTRDKKKQTQRNYEKIVDELKQCIGNLEKKQLIIQQLEQEKITMNEKIKRLTKQNQDLIILMDENKNNKEVSNKKCEMLMQKVSDQEIQLTQKQCEIKSLSKRLEQESKTCQNLTSEIENLHQEIQNLSFQIQNLKKANERFKNQKMRSKLLNQETNQQQISLSKNKEQKSNSKVSSRYTSEKKKKAMNQILEMVKYYKNQDSEQSESDDRE